MNVYLDINGVLLTKDQKQAYFLKELFGWLTDHHCVFWLTTHCKGDAAVTLSYLSQFLDTETLKLSKKIQPTNWNTFKTEAIDFSEKFMWLDDYLFEKEKSVLKEHNAYDSWIPVDLEHNPQQLKDIYDALRS